MRVTFRKPACASLDVMENRMADDIERTITLGTLIAVPKGDGLYLRSAPKPIPLAIKAWVDVETIERGEDGAIEYAYCMFTASHSPQHWDSSEDGGLYTDTGIVEAVNQFLGRLGYKGTVGWSTAGHQDVNLADFDMEYGLIDEIWSDLKLLARPAAVQA